MKNEVSNNILTIYLEDRIDSNNAGKVEEEIGKIIEENKGKKTVFNAGNLAYISSAGLRVLMKYRKQIGVPLDIEEVSREVYEIFETTGFTELFNVKKQLRELSIEGCEKIGQGATAAVYRLDRDTIVKVFNEGVYMNMVENENAKSKAAFLAGIPTAIAYDTVKVGNCYGTVFELLDAVDLLEVWEEDRENLKENVTRFGKEIKRLHQIEIDPEKFKDVRKSSLDFMPRLVGVVGTKEEIDKLTKMYEIVPERKTFIHGDCHPGNIMVQDGEYLFIDLSSGGMGHPIFDLTSMCQVFLLPTLGDDESFENTKKKNIYLRNFSRQEAGMIWDTFIRAYLDTDDDAMIQKATRQVMAYGSLRLLFAAIAVPGLVSEEKIAKMKNSALEYCENIEPLCF